MNAQSGKTNFVGRLIDADSKMPVEFGTVRLLSLPDSVMLTGGVTQKDGKFNLSAKTQAGKKVLLEISYIGYETVDKTLSVKKSNTIVNVGDVVMLSKGFELEEAVVTAQAPMAVTEEDTTVFNAPAFRTPEGSMLDKLVEQLPGAEITQDGVLMIQGKEVKKILIDGKEFFFDDPKAAMKNLPVEMIDKLKAYERKSDLARLTGIDDGEEEMILDLSVKKDMKKGWMNNFFGGAGNKDRYEFGNTLNRFRENTQFTLIANLNNTNNQGFSELQNESANSSGNTRDRTGLVTSSSLGFNYSKDFGRLKLRSNAQYSGTDRTIDSKAFVDNFLQSEKSISQSTNHNKTNNHNLAANVYIEWKIDSLTTLIARPQYRSGSNDRNYNGGQQTFSNDSLLNESVSSGNSDNSQYNASLMLQLSRKLSKTGRNVALKVDCGANETSSHRLSYATTEYYKSKTERIINQKINNSGDGYNYRLQFVYVEPLIWLHFLQFSYSYQHRVNNSDRYVYDWDLEQKSFLDDCDTLSSNSFENQYSNHLFNLAIQTNRKKYSYNFGFNLEPQKTVSNSFLGDISGFPLERKVFNFSPTVNFNYKFSKRTRLRVVYRGTSRQPNIQDLQPVADLSNPLNVHIGNPSLKPSYTNAFSLNYNSYNAKTQRNMVVFLSAESTINSVTNQVTYDSETGARTNMPVNINGNWNADGSFSLNTPLGSKKKWQLRNYSYLQYSNRNGYTTLKKQDPQETSVQHFTGRERLRLIYRTQQFEAGGQGEVLYNNSYNNIRDQRTETYDYRFGGNVQWYLKWGFELYSDFTYRLRQGYGTSVGRETFLWNMQLTKSFLKRKQLLLRFKVYDILHQEKSLERVISASSIRDTEYNVLGSYFMIHAIFRLNIMGK